MSDPIALSLAERLEVEAALDAAFDPLREQRTTLSPLRVRAAVRWGRGSPSAPPAALRWSGTLARLSELSIAAGMSVMVLSATLAPPPTERDGSAADPSEAPAAADGRLATAADEAREIRALRLEWYESLRSRLEALRVDRSIVQDWLDPTVARPAAVQRSNLPAPRVGSLAARSPY